MKIIIVGCGKVGRALADLLSAEQHDITLVDTNASKLRRITEDIDVMGIVGNGADIDTLTEADAQNADILIAMTGSDETNLLVCLMAGKVGHCQTIARVRNPMYSREIDFIKAQLGISMVINPEYAAAQEAARVLRFPAAEKIDTFAHGKIQLFKITIREGMPLDGLEMRHLSSACHCDVLLCAVERGDTVTIPGGSFVLHKGDVISVVASEQNMIQFFANLGLPTKPVSNVLIAGGGRLGFYLTQNLLASKIPVTVIEERQERCDELAELLPGAVIVNGDATDRKLLHSEGLLRAGAFVTLMSLDEENIFLSLYSRMVSKAKNVTKINHITYDHVVYGMDLDSTLQPKFMTADYILQYVRAQQSSGHNIETLYRLLDNRVEAIEFSVNAPSAATDIPLAELSTRDNLLICCIMRDDQVIIPRGSDRIQVGDSIVVVTLAKGLQDVTDILAPVK